MKVSAPTPPPAPAPVDPGKSAMDYINAMSDPALQQRLFDSESQFRPQYNQLNLQDIQQYLQGTNGQQGALDLLGSATQRAGDIQALANTQQRQADIADVQNLGASAAAAYKAANPELWAQFDKASSMGGQSNSYAQLGQAIGGAKQFGDVNVSQVGQGQLGQNLYNQALGAQGLGQVGQSLQNRAMQLSQSTGAMNPDEIRAAQQAVRAAYAARGTEMGSGAVSAEALGRLTNERQRMMEDLQAAYALNQAGQAELSSNRGFQTGVYGQELGRGFGNQAMDAQMGLANREFGAQQQQQQIANYNLLGQLQASQTAQDRAYQLQLLQAQAGMSFDPMQSILGRSSGSIGVGQQQTGFGANLTDSMQGPQLFNPNAGINLGLQNSANLGNYNAATYGAQANAQGQITGGLFSGVGGLFGGLLGGK